MNEYYPTPLPEETPHRKKGYSGYKLALAILIGLIIGIAISIPFYTTDKELLNITQTSFNYGISYGLEYALELLTNQSIQCQQIPINYSGYSYTLYPLECLELNNEGGIKNRKN